MISYNDLYEILRKERYAETLQSLPKDFLLDFSDYLNDRKGTPVESNDLFLENVLKSKKQLENALSIFKEIILRRKKKLLNLVFVAAETGIMKRDYENMLSFEKDMFDKLVKAFEDGDKEIAKLFSGQKSGEKAKSKMIIFTQAVEQFVDLSGNIIGPFNNGELAHLDSMVCDILVQNGKARFVDE